MEGLETWTDILCGLKSKPRLHKMGITVGRCRPMVVCDIASQLESFNITGNLILGQTLVYLGLRQSSISKVSARPEMISLNNVPLEHSNSYTLVHTPLDTSRGLMSMRSHSRMSSGLTQAAAALYSMMAFWYSSSAAT